MKYILITILSLCLFTAESQDYVVKDIKSFGAKGDGKTNDQDAFESASDFFNNRRGNGKLIISAGIYIVGRQTFTGGQKSKPAYNGEDVLHFNSIKNFDIEGQGGCVLKYRDSLRFGAFDPTSGNIHDHGNNAFVDYTYAATIGDCILIQNCSNVRIYGVALDGNSNQIILGGIYGDVGRQLPHYGIYISVSKDVHIDNVYIHHFGLDGICIANKSSNTPDSINITGSKFEYNGRQGFSWTGGNQVYVKNCQFNYTGKRNFSSAPGAGVDIEAEVGIISNGIFEGCDFIDNSGAGVLALAGDSRNCTFTNCNFWGLSSRALWVSKPSYTFRNCGIYGLFLQGYDAENSIDATKFFDCSFKDTVYNGIPTFGGWLIESKNVKRLSFINCAFTSKTKKLCKLSSPESYSSNERYQFSNCKFNIENDNLPANDFAGTIRGAAMKNCVFTFTNPQASQKKYYLQGYNEKSNTDLGGNHVIFK